jgi:non-ribosomal peptide synthetase component F
MARMAVVPLDPSDPPRRLSLLIEDARPAIIVVKNGDSGTTSESIQNILDHLPGGKSIIVVGVSEVEGICRDQHWRRDVDVKDIQDEDTSHVYFTSGSTGRCVCMYV